MGVILAGTMRAPITAILPVFEMTHDYTPRRSPVAMCLGRDGLVGGERENADREWPASRE